MEGEDFQVPEVQPGELSALPDGPGAYRVDTLSGTQHIMTMTELLRIIDSEVLAGLGSSHSAFPQLNFVFRVLPSHFEMEQSWAVLACYM